MERLGRLLDAQRQKDLTGFVPGLQSSLNNLNKGIEGLYDALAEWRRLLEQSYSRSVSQPGALLSGLEASKRIEILQWLSTLPYHHHHESFVKDLIPGLGQWFLATPEFKFWKPSSSSEVFWLRGIHGWGKTRLTAIIVEKLKKECAATPNSAPIACFYCSRDSAEPERADPRQILRAIVKQLSQNAPGDSIFESTRDVYDQKVTEANLYGLLPSAPTVEDCLSLLHKLSLASPLTIVIDAIDECSPSERHQLFKVLHGVIATSANIVKILIASREEDDIASTIGETLGLRVSAKHNANDIANYIPIRVREAIQRGRLLPGVDPSKFEQRIVETLIAKSQGMCVFL